jgi:ubiquinone/menaquinone biosynthesis C-methylase UbiE
MSDNWDENLMKMLAEQLRKPDGEMGVETAKQMNAGNENMNMITIKSLYPEPGDKILEIGMANGFFVKDVFALADGIMYTGCDYSELMVDEANKLNKSFVEKGVVKFYHAAADRLPLQDNFFNKIFTVNTIYFWDNPDSILTELNRVLMPGGKLFAAFRPRQFVETRPFAKYGFNTYSDDEIKAMFERNNFKFLNISETPEVVESKDNEIVETAVAVLTAEKV